MFNVFIGLFLGAIAYFVNISLAIGIGIFLLILNPRVKVQRIVPSIHAQASKLVIDDTKVVEKYSDEIIGTYDDKPIHDYVVIKNPANGVCYRFDYFDIIPRNNSGVITALPQPGQIFFTNGLVYQDSGVVVQLQ